MSDITLQFDPNLLQTQVVVDQNTIQVTPAAIGLNIFTGSAPVAGGNNGALQYNNIGILDGIPTANYTSGNLFLGNSANIKINGGANAYFLQTDGTGNITWAPGTVNANAGNGIPVGANTQIQITDGTGNFVSAPGFTFDNASNLFTAPGDGVFAGNVTAVNFIGNLTGNANYANFAGTVVNAVQSNITSLGVLTALSVNAAVNATQFVSNVSTGTAPFQVLSTTEVTNLHAANANYANSSNTSNTANTVIDAAQPNITSLGNLSQLVVLGNIDCVNVNANGTITSLDANVGNLLTANFIQGTLITGPQPNITQVGNLTGLTVAGNALISILRTTDTEVTLGLDAGLTSQGTGAVAVGSEAGRDSQGQYAVAVGTSAGEFQQSNNAVAIGYYAGYDNQGNFSVAIGSNAASNFQHDNSILINATGSNLDTTVANSFVVKPIRNAGANFALYYNTTSGEISYDVQGAQANYSNFAGNLVNGTTNVSIPVANSNINCSVDGNTNQLVITSTGINVANNTTTQNLTVKSTFINLGNNSVTDNFQGIAIGANATSQQSAAGIAIGRFAVANGANSLHNIALGSNTIAKGSNSIAIGFNAQPISSSNTDSSIAIGPNTRSSSNGISIGHSTGSHRANTIAIGANAGSGNYITSVGIGTDALKSTNLSGIVGAIGLGFNTCNNATGPYPIAIGYDTGNSQGTGAIAIGRLAGYNLSGNGQGNYSIAIGERAGYPNSIATNSIILNATGSNLPALTANALYIKPIRNATNDQTLVYDTTTGEISYTNYLKTISTTVGNLTAANTVGEGARAFVTDANTTTFLSIVGGGGANKVPVVSDGTNWLVG